MKQAKMSILMSASALLVTLVPTMAAPRDRIYSPKPGSSERRAIFNALRVPIAKHLKKPVLFSGSLNASKSGWAFFSGGALIDDGKDGRRLNDGGSNGEMVALLRHSSGKWRVMSWGFGGGMDATFDAMQKYPAAPRALFRFTE
jgi:hypothetical protein